MSKLRGGCHAIDRSAEYPNLSICLTRADHDHEITAWDPADVVQTINEAQSRSAMRLVPISIARGVLPGHLRAHFATSCALSSWPWIDARPRA